MQLLGLFAGSSWLIVKFCILSTRRSKELKLMTPRSTLGNHEPLPPPPRAAPPPCPGTPRYPSDATPALGTRQWCWLFFQEINYLFESICMYTARGARTTVRKIPSKRLQAGRLSPVFPWNYGNLSRRHRRGNPAANSPRPPTYLPPANPTRRTGTNIFKNSLSASLRFSCYFIWLFLSPYFVSNQNCFPTENTFLITEENRRCDYIGVFRFWYFPSCILYRFSGPLCSARRGDRFSPLCTDFIYKLNSFMSYRIIWKRV